MTRKRRLDKWTKKRKNYGKYIFIVIFVLVILGVFLFVGLGLGHKEGEQQIAGSEENFKPHITDTSGSPVQVKVWVPKQGNESVLEKRNVLVIDNKLKLNTITDDLIKLLISMDYLPKNTHLIGNVKVDNGVATINFSEEIREFSGSATEEAGCLESFGKTLINKEYGIKELEFNVSGEKMESLGGHIELEDGIYRP